MASPRTLQILTLSTALFTSGGIATLSAFDAPLLRSQPASRSLPMLRWLFSRGSHLAPTGILLSAAGFLSLSYTSLPRAATASASAMAAHAVRGTPGLYLLASALCASSALFTSFMLPTNFALIAKNEELGGAHSQASAQYRTAVGAAPRSAQQSVDGVQDVSQWTDLSDPQGETGRASTAAEDAEARELLTRFAKLNYVRAVLIGAGGVVGLVAALG